MTRDVLTSTFSLLPHWLKLRGNQLTQEHGRLNVQGYHLAPLNGAERGWGVDLSTKKIINGTTIKLQMMVAYPFWRILHQVSQTEFFMNQIIYIHFLSQIYITSSFLPHRSRGQMSKMGLTGLKVKWNPLAGLHFFLEALGENFFPFLPYRDCLHSWLIAPFHFQRKQILISDLLTVLFCLPFRDPPTQSLWWLYIRPAWVIHD